MDRPALGTKTTAERRSRPEQRFHFYQLGYRGKTFATKSDERLGKSQAVAQEIPRKTRVAEIAPSQETKIRKEYKSLRHGISRQVKSPPTWLIPLEIQP